MEQGTAGGGGDDGGLDMQGRPTSVVHQHACSPLSMGSCMHMVGAFLQGPCAASRVGERGCW